MLLTLLKSHCLCNAYRYILPESKNGIKHHQSNMAYGILRDHQLVQNHGHAQVQTHISRHPSWMSRTPGAPQAPWTRCFSEPSPVDGRHWVGSAIIFQESASNGEQSWHCNHAVPFRSLGRSHPSNLTLWWLFDWVSMMRSFHYFPYQLLDTDRYVLHKSEASA